MDDASSQEEPIAEHKSIFDGILDWLSSFIRWTEEDEENAGIHIGGK